MKISFQSPRKQQGIALFVVIVFVLLSMLLALWASRTALFSEMIVGNDADYQRTFEAAQALIQDAELDLRNQTASGTECTTSNCREIRGKNDSSIPLIPVTGQELQSLLTDLSTKSSTEGCSHALCTKRAAEQDFWNSPATLAKLTTAGVGARYGDYTSATANTGSNPILADKTAATKGGWYWIEVLCHIGGCDDSSSSSHNPDSLIVATSSENFSTSLNLNLSPNAVYRITALAYGRKPGTRVVLQQIYAPTRGRGE